MPLNVLPPEKSLVAAYEAEPVVLNCRTVAGPGVGATGFVSHFVGSLHTPLELAIQVLLGAGGACATATPTAAWAATTTQAARDRSRRIDRRVMRSPRMAAERG